MKSKAARLWGRFKTGLLTAVLRIIVFATDRLQEPMTLRSLMSAIAAVTTWLKPEKVEIIVPLYITALALLQALLPDSWRERSKGKKKPVKKQPKEPS